MTVGSDGAPLTFVFHGRQRVATILERWTEAGEWWDGEHERVIYRVISERGGIFELECRDGQWRLYKEYD